MTKRALLIGGATVLVALPVTYFAYAATLGVSSEKITVHKSGAKILDGSCTLSATQDAYVDEGFKVTSYGAGDLAVRSERNKNRRSFLMFDPTTCALPVGAVVKNAVLAVYLHSPPTSGRVYELRRATSAWTEATLTWNRPATVADAVSASTSVGTVAASLSWTVTSDVVAMRSTPTSNYGWRIADAAEGAATFAESGIRSRDAATNPPTLTITYGP